MSPQLSPHILIIDDDERLRKLLHKYLCERGFCISAAANTAEARKLLGWFLFDLLVVDIMMPGESGMEFLQSIRREGNDVPVMMLTAMGETENKITGLSSGADDYLPKPFDPRELVLRIENILKRLVPPAPKLYSGVFSLGECSYNLERGELIDKEGSPIALSPSLSKLLAFLAERPGQAVSREELARLLGLGNNLRAIDVQMTRLRRKIEAESKTPRYLQTIRGKGYMLRPD